MAKIKPPAESSLTFWAKRYIKINKKTMLAKAHKAASATKFTGIPYFTQGASMAKTKPKRKPRPRKPTQGYLKGMKPPSIPKIDKLADRYVADRDTRMAMLKDEVASRDLLEAAMKEAGLKRYEYDSKVIELVETEKVKVRAVTEEGKVEE